MHETIEGISQEFREFIEDDCGKSLVGLGVKFIKWGAGYQDSTPPPEEIAKLQKFITEATEQERTFSIDKPGKHGNDTYVEWKDARTGRNRRERVKLNRAFWDRLEREQREKEEKERRSGK